MLPMKEHVVTLRMRQKETAYACAGEALAEDEGWPCPWSARE